MKNVHQIYPQNTVAQSAVAVEYTDCTSAEGYPPPMSVLDMTLNSLMVGLWGIQSPPSLLLLPGSLWPGVVVPDRVLSMD